ncbi:hypothetical protein ACFLX7_00890 [Chloroflexota bacterium]
MGNLVSISRKTMLFITACLLSVSLLGSGCAPCQDFDSCLHSIVTPYRFSIASWEFEALLGSEQSVAPGTVANAPVAEYFSLVERIAYLESEIAAIELGNRQGDTVSLEDELKILAEKQAILADGVSRIVTEQIAEALSQQGIFHPLDGYLGWQVVFPPVDFRLEPPPYLLVVSPRYRIESMREITLQPSISLEEIEAIEAGVDELDVSSLVVELGGFGGTYPTLVSNEASLRFTIDTAVEEWLHQYLVFKPLGFLYLLDLIGISRNYEVATINETLAGIVSKEIGAVLYEKHYSDYKDGSDQSQAQQPEFDFNQEMREIRRQVDSYLVRGEIEQAQIFMEQKRQYLASMGHYIRKLNQAYFAFHGAYADRPASISPIGQELKGLREQSSSLKDFLNTVAAMTSRQDLRDSIKQPSD